MFSKVFAKIKNSYAFRNYKEIYQYVAPYKTRALLAVLISIPIGVLDMAIPAGLKYYIDGITSKNMNTIVMYMPLVIVVFSLLQSCSTYIANYMNAWVGAKISNGLKYDLYKKLMQYSAAFFDQNTCGTIQTRFNSDADLACSGLLNNVKSFTRKFFNSVGYVFVLLYVSWKLALLALVVFGLALFPLTMIRKRIKGLADQQVSSGALISSIYIETFGGNRIISSYNLNDYQLNKFANSLKACFNIMIKMVQRTGILSPIMHLIIGSGVAAIMFVGNYFMSTGEMTPGDFTAFVTSVILLYQPLKTLGDEITAVQTSLLAIERVFLMLKTQPTITNRVNAKKITEVKHGIEYRDVCFSYNEDKVILKNINLDIKSGQSIALVGNSGGGKTTIANLLPRFYDVTSGSILIDGTDIRDIDIESLRNQISIVFQDNFLFDGTIKDNILLGKENATQEELSQSIESSCLSEFVNGLKKGINTRTGERGVLLSGGQKQRIAIARAFIKNAPIVILDEATSALDNKSEAVVQQAINNLMKDRTVLIIAHRLSTIRNADKIVVVNYGEIAEIGTHKELISRPNSIYNSLYNAQI